MSTLNISESNDIGEEKSKSKTNHLVRNMQLNFDKLRVYITGSPSSWINEKYNSTSQELDLKSKLLKPFGHADRQNVLSNQTVIADTPTLTHLTDLGRLASETEKFIREKKFQTQTVNHATQTGHIIPLKIGKTTIDPKYRLKGKSELSIHTSDSEITGRKTLTFKISRHITWSSVLQRIPGLFALLTVYLAIYGPAYKPITFGTFFIISHFIFVYSQIRSAYSCYIARCSVRECSSTDWLLKYCLATGTASGSDIRHDMNYDRIKHIIIIPNFKESMETLCETLDVLASHSFASTNYKICMAMEETEEKSELKANALLQMYAFHFSDIVYTIHPKGLPNEIRGKSSNVSWAAKKCVAQEQDLSCCIITVMDADTCFSQDYFAAVNFYYSTASPQQRKLMMFAPPTIFDRNAKNVPGIVRMADVCWSSGAMSHMYPGSPIKFPCSAYSLSMQLVDDVGYWDTSAEAIGEDMHMYLKCFFRTQGRLIVRTIFSPASQCNIEGSNLIGGIFARYTQGKRHIWGSLDTPYCIRQAFNNFWQGFVFKREQFIGVSLLAHLFIRLLEVHIMLGQLFLLIHTTSFLITANGEPTVLWGMLFSHAPSRNLLFMLHLCSILRAVAIVFAIISFVNYEIYHRWVSTDRWVLKVDPETNMPIQPLGRRPHLQSTRTLLNILEYAYLPLCSIPFHIIPQYVVHISQLWTDSLDYKVASKPSLSGKSSPTPTLGLETHNPMQSRSHVLTTISSMTKVHEMGQRFLGTDIPDEESALSSSADSAFYENDKGPFSNGA